jgi:hypothetical protein
MLSGAIDDDTILTAASHNILVEDVHAGGDKRNGGTRGLLHHGSISGSNKGEFRHRGDGEGKVEATGKNKGRRHQEGSGHQVPGVHGGVARHSAEMCGQEGEQREITRGIYSDQLTEVMGEGAIDEEGHKNTQFLRATTIGPCLGEMQKALEVLRNEAAENPRKAV